MSILKYNLDDEGKISAIGYSESYEFELNSEPFGMLDAFKWQKINNQWIYIGDFFEIPINPIVEYDMIPPCPVDDTVELRKIYWTGEKHEVMDSFRINLLVLHFDKDGNRMTKWDKMTWTQADTQTMIDNPLNPGEQVNEYDFFMSIVQSGQMTLIDAVLLGIQRADLDGTINRRIYGIS
jgi:hypothetical protein